MPRKPSCECGTCRKCKARIAARERYQSMTPEERRAWIARRDPERVRRQDRRRYDTDREKRRAAQRAYLATPAGREAKRRADREWARRHALEKAAHRAVRRALEEGRLVRPDVCEQAGPGCSGQIEAHHDDYGAPLDVRWLCVAHHNEHHTTERALPR